MKKLSLFLLTILLFTSYCYAQSGNYAVSKIPAPLLNNADAILRNDETKMTINDIGHATVYDKYAITVLNEAGDSKANFVISYDKFRTVSSIEGNLFDANGKKIRSMKKDDLKDYGNVSDFEMANDSRVKFHNFYCKNYPYTVEYEFEMNYNGTLDFPGWTPVKDEKFSVEKSTMEIACPLSYQLRYKSFNYNGTPLIDSNSKTKTYQWVVNNMASITEEQYEPEWFELTPTVFIAPSDFEFQDYKGNMTTWNDFGKFIYALNQGRDELPKNIKLVVHSLTDSINDIHNKIRTLYKYLQNNTRYVAIELGIGGLQTFDANYVATKGYGDCKALSNYMHSLLKEAGIKSYCTLAKAGYAQKNLLKDFPSNQFNHVIVCVPLKTDTMWLECTSQQLSAGYLGDFTDDRDVLLFDENGGKLLHTPIYGADENVQSRNIEAKIDSTGTLSATVNATYTGIEQDDLNEKVNSLSKDKILEYLKDGYIDIPSYDITGFNYKKVPDAPVMHETLEIVSNNYASVSGKRIFITPDILTHNKTTLEDTAQRVFDLVLPEGHTYIDSVKLSVPLGYKVEAEQNNIYLNSKFGHYLSIVKFIPGQITYYRFFKLNSGRYPATDAKDFATFLAKIYKADRIELVLVKNE